MNQEELNSQLEGEPSVTKLQSLHDDIREHTDLYVPNRPSEVEDWWERKKSVVTRRLSPDEEQAVEQTEEETEEEHNETDN
mgnify:CR=1 FL=1